MGPLTGEHGVMIPEANVPYLMLREDVVQGKNHNLILSLISLLTRPIQQRVKTSYLISTLLKLLMKD